MISVAFRWQLCNDKNAENGSEEDGDEVEKKLNATRGKQFLFCGVTATTTV